MEAVRQQTINNTASKKHRHFRFSALPATLLIAALCYTTAFAASEQINQIAKSLLSGTSFVVEQGENGKDQMHIYIDNAGTQNSIVDYRENRLYFLLAEDGTTNEGQDITDLLLQGETFQAQCTDEDGILHQFSISGNPAAPSISETVTTADGQDIISFQNAFVIEQDTPDKILLQIPDTQMEQEQNAITKSSVTLE